MSAMLFQPSAIAGKVEITNNYCDVIAVNTSFVERGSDKESKTFVRKGETRKDISPITGRISGCRRPAMIGKILSRERDYIRKGGTHENEKITCRSIRCRNSRNYGHPDADGTMRRMEYRLWAKRQNVVRGTRCECNAEFVGRVDEIHGRNQRKRRRGRVMAL